MTKKYQKLFKIIAHYQKKCYIKMREKSSRNLERQILKSNLHKQTFERFTFQV